MVMKFLQINVIRLEQNSAQQLWGDKYQVIVCTHTNKKNVHNHIVLNLFHLLMEVNIITQM